MGKRTDGWSVSSLLEIRLGQWKCRTYQLERYAVCASWTTKPNSKLQILWIKKTFGSVRGSILLYISSRID
jgi:hypothetical protein